MIYLTGDTHGDFTRLTEECMRNKSIFLTQDDYVIVCGDFGMCWASDRSFIYNCEFFYRTPCTVLWVQGNHENYDMLREFAVENWHGGKVRHIVRDKVILLERGQVFEIEGKKFFTFGGASSYDIQGGVLDRKDADFAEKVKRAKEQKLPYRIFRENWWPEELPSKMEMFEGLKNLESVNNEVDYIITHCCASSIQSSLGRMQGQVYEQDVLTDYFEQVEKQVCYKHWYFGHYHDDMRVDEKHTLLYRAVLPLGDTETDLTRIPRPGYPKYRHGDVVSFKDRQDEKKGKIVIVDAYGTFEQNEEPSYDILVEKPERCLYKHVAESCVIG